MDALTELAMDLRWSWNHCSDELWRRLDAETWALTRHPNVVLQTVTREKLVRALTDPDFRQILDRLVLHKRQAAVEPAWFQEKYPQAPLTCVAYFCMEFMLTEALPIYSGGLGNVAGDQLKAADDLGVPVVGIGLLYQHGYFRQVIDRNGAQHALYPANDPAQLPITPVCKPDGEYLRLEIPLPGGSVWLRAWQVQVGRRRLYLLDSNDTANVPIHRGITSELYGGGPELRLKQEIVLGLGGWQLLDALGLKPEVCHLNEGHAALALLARACSFMKETGNSFPVALAATRVGNVFTTHTAVPSGFDIFSPELVQQYLGRYAKDTLGLTMDELLALGRKNPTDDNEPFNMAHLAVRGSGSVNGVSRLHGQVSRHIFAPLYPRQPEEEVPIGYVTNGVHIPTWDSVAADSIWTDACGKSRWLGTSDTIAKDLREVTDEKLWAMRTANRRALVEYAREGIGRQLAAVGTEPASIVRTQTLLDPRAMILGFARRFTAYKRPNLLLHDPDRLLSILNHPSRPTQLILAGKAHPADLAGQALIQEWTQFISRHGGVSPVFFLADYDMLLAEHMVQGVDVWINTPRRPWEACGTSGMKVLVNGGINVSELDGWWAEAYAPEVGWALGDVQEHEDDGAWDAVEANDLYDKLEREIIPEFFARAEDGIPKAWVARMRESMARLTPKFSASRAVREYTEKHYVPAARTYQTHLADKGAGVRSLLDAQNVLVRKLDFVRFGAVTVETQGALHLFTVEVFLGGVPRDMVRVELYADGANGGPAVDEAMTATSPSADEAGGTAYHASVPSARPAMDYTARILMKRGLQAPDPGPGWMLWQK